MPELSQFMPAALTTSAANNASTPIVENGFPSTGFILICSALVMLMTPAVGLFYSGLSHSRNALTIIMISFLSYAVVCIQWICFGFSLSFAENGSPVIGNFNMAGFTNVLGQGLSLTAPAVPAIVFALYQLQFATVTVAIVFGAVCERVRLIPSIVFMFLWTTLVYDPVAYWTWAARGWIRNMSCLSTIALDQTPCQIGGLDFAGGGPVHIASGAAALAFCIFLGKKKTEETKPHNVTFVFIGTALLWFGWFGFNAGSSVNATARSGMAALVTTVSASAGGLTWMVIDSIPSGKLSGVGFCSGVIAGLVGITPAAGFVAPWAAIVIGVISSACCNYATNAKDFLGYDDHLDAFGLHGVGGIVGNLLTGFFASKSIATLDGGVINGGFVDSNWVLLGYQAIGSLAIFVYSALITYLLLLLINLVPGLKLRISEEKEILGLDVGEMGEVAYELAQNGTATALSDMKTEKEPTVNEV
ncbi:hypothetical protein HDV02_001586 [Globomyces sp. JEL0801]|nr:hypothetical protein HDV02_001586 [Globomyces sp. JEL0801]